MSENLIQVPQDIADQLAAGRAASEAVAAAEDIASVEQARMTRDEIAAGMVSAGIAQEAIDAQRALNPSVQSPMVDALGPNVINSPRR